MENLTQTTNTFAADFQGEYIELTVRNGDGKIINKYAIDNDGDPFSAWCIENNYAGATTSEFDPDDAEEEYPIQYNTNSCKENPELVLHYILEQIHKDFFIQR